MLRPKTLLDFRINNEPLKQGIKCHLLPNPYTE